MAQHTDKNGFEDNQQYSGDNGFHEAQPPQMIDSLSYPPLKSDSKEIGRVILDIGDVYDPKYPWEDMDHYTDSSYKKREALRRRKEEEVHEYAVIRNIFWQQYRHPQYYVNDIKETIEVYIGTSETVSSEFSTNMEIELGLKKGIWEAKAKMAVGFKTSDSKTFSQYEKKITEEAFSGGYHYLFWQIVDEFSVYRKPQIGGNLQEVCKYYGASQMTQMNKFSFLSENTMLQTPRLTATAKVLKKGQSRNFETYGSIFTSDKKTTFFFMNKSDDEDGSVHLHWKHNAIPGKTYDVDVDVPVGPMKKYSVAINGTDCKITNNGPYDIEVWSNC